MLCEDSQNCSGIQKMQLCFETRCIAIYIKALCLLRKRFHSDLRLVVTWENMWSKQRCSSEGKLSSFLTKRYFQFYVLEEEKVGSIWRRKPEVTRVMNEIVLFSTCFQWAKRGVSNIALTKQKKSVKVSEWVLSNINEENGLNWKKKKGGSAESS